MTSERARLALAFGLLAVAAAGALRGIVERTLEQNGYYDHLAFVPLISAWIAWRIRPSGTPTGFGYLPLALGLWVIVSGRAESVLLPQALGLVIALVGLALLSVGWRGTWQLRFPLAFLLLALPLPRIVIDLATGGLKRLVTVIAVHALALLDVPAVEQGTRILVRGGTIEVDDACSGLKGARAVVGLGALLAREQAGPLRASAVFLASLPAAMLANLTRVLALSGLAIGRGEPVGEGVAHTVLGLVAYAIGLGLLLAAAALAGGERGAQGSEPRLSSARARIPRPAVAVLAVGALLAWLVPHLVRQNLPAVPVPRLEAGEWTGEVIELHRSAARSLYVRYRPATGAGRPVDLYLIHGLGSQIDVHLPAACFPGVGFVAVASAPTTIRVGERSYPAIREVFARGTEEYLTVHWYLVEGRPEAAPDFHRLKLGSWLGRLALRSPGSVLLIRVTTPLDADADARVASLSQAVLPATLAGDH